MQRITFVNTMMGRRRSWGGDEDGGGEAPRGELTFPPRRDSSLPLPLLASTIVHTQLITSGSIWRKSEIFLEGCRVPQNVAHCCLLEFSPISCFGSRPPSDIALQCSCGQNSDLVTGLNIRITRFYPTNAHLQMAMSATSHGSNWWWSLPTASRTNLYLLQRRFYKNLLFCFLLRCRLFIIGWVKRPISHIFIKILNMVSSLSHRYSLPTATQLIANMINWLYHIFVCGIDSLFSLIMKVDLVLIKYILSLHSKIHLWMVHKYTRLSNFSLYYRNYRIIWLSLCSIIQIHYFIIFLRLYYLSIFSVFITSDDLWWHNKRF